MQRHARRSGSTGRTAAFGMVAERPQWAVHYIHAPRAEFKVLRTDAGSWASDVSAYGSK